MEAFVFIQRADGGEDNRLTHQRSVFHLISSQRIIRGGETEASSHSILSLAPLVGVSLVSEFHTAVVFPYRL